MIGLLGAALVTGGGLLLGRSRGKTILRRRDILRRAGRDLKEAARLLAWQSPPLPELMNRLAEGEGELGSLWRCCVEALGRPDRPSFGELWEDELERADFPLIREENALLQEAGVLFGRFRQEEQAAALSDLARRLSKAADQAEEDWRRMNRVYCTLGGSGGLLLAILLL